MTSGIVKVSAITVDHGDRPPVYAMRAFWFRLEDNHLRALVAPVKDFAEAIAMLRALFGDERLLGVHDRAPAGAIHSYVIWPAPAAQGSP